MASTLRRARAARIALALMALVPLACDGALVAVGEPCAGPFDCVEGAVCFADAEGPADEGRCMAVCDPDQRLCVGGEVCLASASDPELRVCYLGGPVAVGVECSDSTQCEPGAVCVDPGDGLALCFEACDRRAPACPAGQICETLTDPAGFCTVPTEEPMP